MTQTLRQLEISADGTAQVGNLVVPCMNALRGMQGRDGEFVRDLGTARRVLEDLGPSIAGIYRRFGQEELATALEADLPEWLRRGLDTPPVFSRTRAAYRTPVADGPVFFFGPVRAAEEPASRSCFLEAFLAWREEPEECRRVAALFPVSHIRRQPARILRATEGIASGNDIVFSAEYIAGRGAVTRPGDGLCFFNKFNRIYHERTLPVIRRLFGRADAFFGGGTWASGDLTPEECYRARCVVCYLRQHFTHMNSRPGEHPRTGPDWCASLLQETAVDCRTALACLEAGVPFGREAFQFTLFERLLGDPRQPGAAKFNGAGPGVFLFEWFYAKGAIGAAGNGRLRIGLEAVCDALRALIEATDSLGRLTDDAACVAGAKALVRHYLPEGARGERFTLPEAYRSLAGAPPRTDAPWFDRLEY